MSTRLCTILGLLALSIGYLSGCGGGDGNGGVDPPVNGEIPPFLVCSVSSSVNGPVQDVAATNGFAYVAGDEGSLQIIDIDPPGLAHSVNTMGTTGYKSHGVAVSGEYVYVANYPEGLQIFDVIPLDSAHLVNTIKPSHHEGVKDVVVVGDYAYVGDVNNALLIIKIDPPESASIVNSIEMPGDAEKVAVSGGYAYVVGGGGYGLQIVDVNPIDDAHLVTSLHIVDTPKRCSNVVVSDRYAYIAYGNFGSGLVIVNIDQPESAFIVNTVDTKATYWSAFGIAVEGGFAYITCSNYGKDYKELQIIDIDPPELANVINSVELPGAGGELVVSGNYAYIAAGWEGLQIVELW